VKEWKDRTGVTYPLYLDASGSSFRLFGQSGIPTNVILDKQRKLRYVEAGFNPDGMKQVLEEMVE
jgi:hypothetical protein